MATANQDKILANLLNTMTFKTIYTRLQNLALNVFKWSGLPDGLKQEYIEKSLYFFGQALFFKDPDMSYLCLQCAPDGSLNVYNEPIRFRAIGNIYNKEYTIDNSVWIKNNLGLISTHDYIMLYTNQLYEIRRSIDVNIKAQKTPYILTCTDKDLLSFKNIYAQIDGNVPVIFADKGMNLKNIEVLETAAPFVADKLSMQQHEVMDDIMSFLGINNSNTDKKERLIVDEVNSNNEYIIMNVDFMLEERLKACEAINKMFGLSVSVDLKNKPAPEQAEQDPNADQNEGDTNG